MAAITRGQTINKANPVLSTWIHQAGTLVTPLTLAYQIFDVSTEAKELSPVQVYPPTEGDEQLVDLVTAKLGTGKFAATWTVPATEPFGRHRIVWYAVLESGGEEYSTSEDFDVLEGVGAIRQPGYILVSDMRDEGFTPSRISTTKLIRKIESASKAIDTFTRLFFEPRELTLRVDGNHSKALLLDYPILTITSVEVADYNGQVSLSDLAIYNRHITNGRPDDRKNPKIEWFHSSSVAWGRTASTIFDATSNVWRVGTKNITINGIFGYTEGKELKSRTQTAFFGTAPEDIRHVAKLLVVRDMERMSRPEDRFEAMNRHRIRSESTRDQSYSLGPGVSEQGGAWTGDWEIDHILQQYQAPVAICST